LQIVSRAHSRYAERRKIAFGPFVRAQPGEYPEKAAMNLSSREAPAFLLKFQ